MQLEVLDVDPLGAERLGDPGEDARPVGHVDAHAVEILRHRGIGRLRACRRRLPAASPIQRARNPASSRSSARLDLLDAGGACSRSPSSSASRLSRKMSTQMRGLAPAIRVMSRSDPPAAASGSWPSTRARAGLVDEQVREHVRQVARQRDQPVVRVGVDRHGTRAELGDEAVHGGGGGRRRSRRSGSGTRSRPRTDRPRAFSAPRASEPAHRVAADEAAGAAGRGHHAAPWSSRRR